MKLVIMVAGFAAGLVAPHVDASPAPDTPFEVAACVVDNAGAQVRVLLKTMPGSPAEAAAAKPVMDYYGGCNDNKAADGKLAWRDRAEIADAALGKRMGSKTLDPATVVARLDWMLTIAKGQVAGKDYDAMSVGMRMLGDCVVRMQPQAAVDLARSASGSAEEQASIGQLALALAPCVPAGQNLRVKRADLRLVVAEPLYHLFGK